MVAGGRGAVEAWTGCVGPRAQGRLLNAVDSCRAWTTIAASGGRLERGAAADDAAVARQRRPGRRRLGVVRRRSRRLPRHGRQVPGAAGTAERLPGLPTATGCATSTTTAGRSPTPTRRTSTRDRIGDACDPRHAATTSTATPRPRSTTGARRWPAPSRDGCPVSSSRRRRPRPSRRRTPRAAAARGRHRSPSKVTPKRARAEAVQEGGEGHGAASRARRRVALKVEQRVRSSGRLRWKRITARSLNGHRERAQPDRARQARAQPGARAPTASPSTVAGAARRARNFKV